jgi:two-component system response regulator YesN
MMAFLVNFKSGDPERLGEYLRESLLAGMVLIKKLHIRLTLAVSSIKNGINGISEACHEAGKAMESRILFGESRLLEYSQSSKPGDGYYYPIEMELKLVNHIKIGDFESSEAIIKEIFKRNFAADAISIEMARHLLFDIESTLLKSMGEGGKPGGQAPGSGRYRIEQLGGCSDLSDLEACTLGIVKDLCGKNADRHKKVRQQCEHAIDYIKNHYTDINLGVPMIAGHLGITADYLSRQFKRQVGESIVNYIHRHRINVAKQFLVRPDESLAEVARKVGCLSTNTLIRLFKKYEGVTPGHYRRTLDASYLPATEQAAATRKEDE